MKKTSIELTNSSRFVTFLLLLLTNFSLYSKYLVWLLKLPFNNQFLLINLCISFLTYPQTHILLNSNILIFIALAQSCNVTTSLYVEILINILPEDAINSEILDVTKSIELFYHCLSNCSRFINIFFLFRAICKESK